MNSNKVYDDKMSVVVALLSLTKNNEIYRNSRKNLLQFICTVKPLLTDTTKFLTFFRERTTNFPQNKSSE